MFKDRLREARLNQGLTQAQLAQRIGVVNSTIASYETGRSDPDMRRLVLLVAALRVDVDYLLQDEMNGTVPVKQSISTDSLSVAQKYDLLTEHGQKVVSAVIDLELEHSAQDAELSERLEAAISSRLPDAASGR